MAGQLIEIEVHGLAAMSHKFTSLRNLIPGWARRQEQRTAEELRQAVIANASGRPGPNVVTGGYVDQINIEQIDGHPAVVSRDPRTQRLEYGFVGVDARGVTVNAPPYPHWRPAIDEIRTRLQPEWRKDLKRFIGATR